MPVTLNASTSSGLIATSDTSGNIELQSNGTTKATVSSSGLAIGQYNPSASLITSGTAQNSTSGTFIDFTGIPSWVKRVTVLFNGVSTNGSSNVLVQLGTSSGIVSSGYAAGGTFSGPTSGNSNYTTGIGSPLNGASDLRHGQITFQLQNSSTNTWVAAGVLALSDVPYSSTMGGSVTLPGTLDRVRITTVGGTNTFDAGIINILYE